MVFWSLRRYHIFADVLRLMSDRMAQCRLIHFKLTVHDTCKLAHVWYIYMQVQRLTSVLDVMNLEIVRFV